MAMETLAGMLRERSAHNTDLDRWRAGRSAADNEALDSLLGDLNSDVAADLVGQLGSFERILLLIAVRQQRRLESLEYCLKRLFEERLAESLKEQNAGEW